MSKNLYYDDYQENKLNRLLEVSNPKEVIKKLHEYLKDDTVKLYISSRKNNKYMIIDPNTGHSFIHFGHINYEDFTKHKDEDRRRRYLARATKIRGNWADYPLSPNNLSLRTLWNWDGK